MSSKVSRFAFGQTDSFHLLHFNGKKWVDNVPENIPHFSLDLKRRLKTEA